MCSTTELSALEEFVTAEAAGRKVYDAVVGLASNSVRNERLFRSSDEDITDEKIPLSSLSGHRGVQEILVGREDDVRTTGSHCGLLVSLCGRADLHDEYRIPVQPHWPGVGDDSAVRLHHRGIAVLFHRFSRHSGTRVE